ncbi:MAG: hypothetical protein EXR72_15955 [Myxococcales bacterium]|nr:hypothetical protein [Myxococcales bacterium]
MRFYNQESSPPEFVAVAVPEGERASDRWDEAMRSRALAFLSEGPAVQAPVRGRSLLEELVQHTADEAQPFYRVLALSDDGGTIAALLGFGMIAGEPGVYDFFSLAARDRAWASAACAAWCRWLDGAAARVTRAEVDAQNAEVVERLVAGGFRIAGRLPAFYAAGEDQMVLRRAAADAP